MFMLSLIKTMIGGFIVKKSTLYSIIMLLLVLVFTQLDAIAFAEDSFELVTVNRRDSNRGVISTYGLKHDINQAIRKSILQIKYIFIRTNLLGEFVS